MIEICAPLMPAYATNTTSAKTPVMTNARVFGSVTSLRGLASAAMPARSGRTPIPIARAPDAQAACSRIRSGYAPVVSRQLCERCPRNADAPTAAPTPSVTSPTQSQPEKDERQLRDRSDCQQSQRRPSTNKREEDRELGSGEHRGGTGEHRQGCAAPRWLDVHAGDQPEGKRRERIRQRLLDEDRRVREGRHDRRAAGGGQRVPGRNDEPCERVRGKDRRRHGEDEQQLRGRVAGCRRADPPDRREEIGDERREAVGISAPRGFARLGDRAREPRELDLVAVDRRNRVPRRLPRVERGEPEVERQQRDGRQQAGRHGSVRSLTGASLRPGLVQR